MDAKELKIELSKKGYATRSLWHMEAVQVILDEYNECNETNYRLTAWECSEIMEEVLQDDKLQNLIIELIEEQVTKRIE
jgi:hypothetical protein